MLHPDSRPDTQIRQSPLIPLLVGLAIAAMVAVVVAVWIVMDIPGTTTVVKVL